jgi:uncharacterized protein RhaS with RHS repeats
VVGATGFYYLRARYYDSSTGQFTSSDPAVTSTRQPYGYVAGDPLNLSDSTGLGPFDLALPGGGALGGGAIFDIGACVFGGCEAAVAATPFVLAAGAGALIGVTIAPAVSQGLDATNPFLVGAAQWVGSNILHAKKSRPRTKNDQQIDPHGRRHLCLGKTGRSMPRRACDDQFGPGNYDTRPDSAYNKLKKWLDRRSR